MESGNLDCVLFLIMERHFCLTQRWIIHLQVMYITSWKKSAPRHCLVLIEQLDVSEELYGGNLKFYFTRKDVDDILSQMTGYHEQIIERVRTVLYMQMRKYEYLF